MGGSTLHYIFVIQNISIILIILSELFFLQRISFHPGIDQNCKSKTKFSFHLKTGALASSTESTGGGDCLGCYQR